MMATTEANSILDHGSFNERYLLLLGSNPVTLFDKTTALRDDAVIDCLIKWVQYSPEPFLSPCMDTADLFSLFLYQFSLPSSLCYEQIFSFRLVSKTPKGGGGSIMSEWLSYLELTGLCLPIRVYFSPSIVCTLSCRMGDWESHLFVFFSYVLFVKRAKYWAMDLSVFNKISSVQINETKKCIENS